MTASLPPPASESGRLEALERLATEAAAEEIAREARELAGRLAEGRFYVACVGQFKRGKSTLLNALLGEAVLPAGVTPVTSVVTVVRHGQALAVRVSLEDGRSLSVPPEALSGYVSEAENPGNERGVRAVEVFHPSRLLEGGLCLVDTPGLGSVFGANAEATKAFVPHIDAVLAVVGADPPISGAEAALVEEVAGHGAHLVVVLNKADRVADADRDEAARFTARVLSERLGRPVGPILEVSAAERILRGEPTRDWNAFEKAVSALGQGAGAALVRAAEARGVERLGRALVRDIEERRLALSRPLEESERRLAGFRLSVAGAERALRDLGTLLAGEEAHLTREFRERHERFHPEALRRARGELEAGIRSLGGPRWRLRARSYELAREVARRAVEAFRREAEPAAEEAYRRSTERFVALANEFLDRVARSGEPGMDRLPRAVGPEPGFRARSGLFYTSLMYLTTNPLPWALDLLRSRDRTVRALRDRVGDYLGRVLESNGSRVANDLSERVAASRRGLEAELRGALRRVVAVAEGAIERARLRRSEGEGAVRAELLGLESLSRRVESLLALPGGAEPAQAAPPP